MFHESLFLCTLIVVSISRQIDKLPAKKLIIVGQYRSGSSFTGELFSSFPNSFYFFEPFHFLHKETNHAPNDQTGIQLVNGLINCQFFEMVKNQTWRGLRWALKKEIVKMFDDEMDEEEKEREDNNQDNYDVSVVKIGKVGKRLEDKCKESDGIVIKAIRLRMDLVETYFDTEYGFDGNSSSDVHVILLLRDPRGIISSRMSFGPCRNRFDCLNSDKLCNEMSQDYSIYSRLKSRFPNHFHLIKFEDLVRNPKDISVNLYQKIGFPITDKLFDYVDLHTKSTKLTEHLVRGHPFNTFRESKEIGEKWMTKLKNRRLRRIERDCSQFLDQLNYEKLLIN